MWGNAVKARALGFEKYSSIPAFHKGPRETRHRLLSWWGSLRSFPPPSRHIQDPYHSPAEEPEDNRDPSDPNDSRRSGIVPSDYPVPLPELYTGLPAPRRPDPS